MHKKRINRLSWLPLLFFFLFLACGFNKAKTPPSKPELENPLNPMAKEEVSDEALQKLLEPDKITDFRLGPEDKIEISVRDEDDLTKEVIVGPDGNISFPMIGTIRAADKTIDELKADIEYKLERYILQPQVGVIVRQYNSQGYYVLGKVKNPGYYGLRSNATVLRAISEAAGITPPLAASDGSATIETADLSGAYIARDNRILPVNFQRLLLDGDMSQNIPLRPKDFIYIPSSLDKKVLVMGEVEKPDSIRFGTNITIVEAITEAGGFDRVTAQLDDVKLIRGPLRDPQIFSVNVEEILAGKAKDVQLQRRDIVYIPPTRLTTASRVMTQVLPFLQIFNTAAVWRLGDSKIGY